MEAEKEAKERHENEGRERGGRGQPRSEGERLLETGEEGGQGGRKGFRWPTGAT